MSCLHYVINVHVFSTNIIQTRRHFSGPIITKQGATIQIHILPQSIYDYFTIICGGRAEFICFPFIIACENIITSTFFVLVTFARLVPNRNRVRVYSIGRRHFLILRLIRTRGHGEIYSYSMATTSPFVFGKLYVHL